MDKNDKKFDGLDLSKLNQEDLIGITTGSRNSPWPQVGQAVSLNKEPSLDINVEDPEGILSDDFGEIFQTAIKNIINVTGQLKTISAEENIKDGGDIFLDLAVSHQEAKKGGYLPLEYHRHIICSQCHNENLSGVQKCFKCEGSGTVTASRRVEIKLPKDVKDGMVLQIPHEGHAPSIYAKENKSGDLFVKIVIKEET